MAAEVPFDLNAIVLDHSEELFGSVQQQQQPINVQVQGETTLKPHQEEESIVVDDEEDETIIQEAVARSRKRVQEEDQNRKQKRHRKAVAVETPEMAMLTNAPLPIKDAAELERRTGLDTGAYFVELGRNRIKALIEIQKRWLQRKCNKKNLRCAWLQDRVCKFFEDMEVAYAKEFGEPAASDALRCADVRRKK